MLNEHVHPIFRDILNSFAGTSVPSDTLPTSEGDKTVPEIMDTLMWGSYKANRGYGLTHEQLGKLGIGNEAMRLRYEQETKNTNARDKTIGLNECPEPWIYWWETLRIYDKRRLLLVHIREKQFSDSEFGFGGELVDPTYIQAVWEAEKPGPLPHHEWLSLAASILQDPDTFTEDRNQEIWRQVYRIASERI